MDELDGSRHLSSRHPVCGVDCEVCGLDCELSIRHLLVGRSTVVTDLQCNASAAHCKDNCGALHDRAALQTKHMRAGDAARRRLH